MCLMTVSAYADRTQLKPGFNLFSPEQDVEMGRQVAQEAEQQLPILNNRQAEDYLNRLGRQLAARAPGEKYPYQFKIVNALITNFHQPKSTLLMMISAFAGYENVMKAYTHAIEEKYRFLSYGDAMLIV